MIPSRKSSFLLLIFVGLVCGVLFHQAQALAAPQVSRLLLSNQLVVLVIEEHSLPFVTFNVLIDAGAAHDAPGQEGLANVAVHGLSLGSYRHSAAALNEMLDYMGSSLELSCRRDSCSVGLKVLKKHLMAGFDLLMEVLTLPTFSEEAIQKQIVEITAIIKSAEDQPGRVAENTFRKALYGDGPYGDPVEGKAESLATINREDVVGFYQTYYHPNNCIVTVVGDITQKEVKELLVPALEAWPAREVPVAAFPEKPSQGPETVKINRPITQANIVIGHAGIERSNPDFHALSVMNCILGGGSVSRLVEEIRVKRGLAYSVTSYFDAQKHGGSFLVVLQTKSDSADEAISMVLQQLDRLQRERVAVEELEAAKQYLMGSFPLRLATQVDLADLASQIEYYGLGRSYFDRYPTLIAAVTVGDVQRVAKKYLHPEHCILTIVGDLKAMALDDL